MAKISPCMNENQEFRLHTEIGDFPSYVIAKMENKPLFSRKTRINHSPIATFYSQFPFPIVLNLFSVALPILLASTGVQHVA